MFSLFRSISSSLNLLSSTRSFSSTPITELTRKLSPQKLKTHKGAAKRWLLTSNNYKRMRAGKVHLSTVKSSTRINELGRVVFATNIQKKLLGRLLPYSK